MTPEGSHSAGTTTVRLTAVALPAEHGSWGFLAEALSLTLLATPAAVALPLVAMALAGFLAHHPLRLWLDDRLRGRSVPRTGVAGRFALGAGAAAAAGLAVALGRAPDPALLLAPLGIALPLVGAQLALAARGRGRALPAELLGAGVPGAVAAAAAAGQGLGVGTAAVLWLLLLGRALPAVLFVRARLRLGRGEAVSPWACHAAHAGVLAAAVAFAGSPALPASAVPVFSLLWLRALAGLAWKRPLRPQRLGIAELCIGLLAAVALGAGLRVAG